MSSHAHGRNSTDGRVQRLKPHNVGVQVSRRFHPEVPKEDAVRELRRHLGEVFHKLALQKDSKIVEGHLMPDHVHMLISIPPKYAVSQVVGSIKGKSAIHLARVYGERKRNFVGQHFCQYGGARRAGDTGLHPQPGEGRSQRLDQLHLWR